MLNKLNGLLKLKDFMTDDDFNSLCEKLKDEQGTYSDFIKGKSKYFFEIVPKQDEKKILEYVNSDRSNIKIYSKHLLIYKNWRDEVLIIYEKKDNLLP